MITNSLYIMYEDPRDGWYCFWFFRLFEGLFQDGVPWLPPPFQQKNVACQATSSFATTWYSIIFYKAELPPVWFPVAAAGEARDSAGGEGGRI